jgi:hypothetical protein
VTEDPGQGILKNCSRIAGGIRGAKCNILIGTDEETAILIRFTQARPIAIDVFGVPAGADHLGRNWQTRF